MPPKYRLEPLDARHIPEILEVERASNPAPWTEASFRGETRNTQAHYRVALSDGRAVAFAGYWAVIDEAHITNLAVHPDHRRKGLGRRLIVDLLEDAVKRGMRCSTLEVRRKNGAAIALYEQMGFVRCAVRKRYYPNDRQDAVVMWLYDLDKRPWST